MKIGKLKKIEKSFQPELTPEQHAEDLTRIADELAEIGRKMPENNLPTPTTAQLKEEYQDIVSGKETRTLLINRFDGKTVEIKAGEVREINSSGETGNLLTSNSDTGTEKVDSIYSQDELEILERLKI